MNYVENNFYPSWLPEELRNDIDLSELSTPTDLINKVASSLMKTLDANIAIYTEGNKIKPGGLCSVYKSASLNEKQLNILNKAEQELKGYVIVAYSKPLEKHAGI